MMAQAIEELRALYPGVFAHKNKAVILRIVKASYHNTGDFKHDMEAMKDALTKLADKLILEKSKKDNEQLSDEDEIQF